MGGRSRAAAQYLSGQGYEQVYNLNGGIKAWQGAKAVGPEETGMFLLRGDEPALEVILLAYGMEEGLRSFYEIMAMRTEETGVRDSLLKLAGIEVNHKERLFQAYENMAGTIQDQFAFEGAIVYRAMEGGLTTEEFLELNKPSLESAVDVISMAMMLETQALDLYMRFSRKSRDLMSREVFHDLAEEEKTHLSTLGRIIDAKV